MAQWWYNPKIFEHPARALPLSVRGMARVSKFGALFPNFRGLSLAAIAAADLRTLIPTIATAGRQRNNAVSDWLTKTKRKQTYFVEGHS